jgi:ParB family chromosome partitioning protein
MEANLLATDLLNAHLRATDISQRQFSKETGLPKSTVGDICAGRAAEISKSTAEILAPILKSSVAELMGIEVHGLAPAPDGTASGLQLIPWAEIQPSPLNPRRTFEEEAIRELADSLFEHGQMQNIVLRRVAFPRPNEAKYQLVAGERRWRATGYNIQVLKRWQPDQPMASKVIEAGDDQHRALALLENLQRVDLTPLEEAEAFKTLIDLKWSTAQIAERINKTQRFVQQRLSLVVKLTEDARTALSEGKINIEQARALTGGTEKQQKDILKRITVEDRGFQTGSDIRHRLMGDLIPVDRAIFDRASYTGEIRGDDQEREYFVDKKAFETLQKQAAKDLAATKRKEGWRWVQQSTYLSNYEYEKKRSTDKKKSGVLIVLDWKGEVTIHEGLVKKTEGKSSGSGLSKAEREEQTKQQAERAQQRKQLDEATASIQSLLRNDPAMALRRLIYRNQYTDNNALAWTTLSAMSIEALATHIAATEADEYILEYYIDVSDLALIRAAGIVQPDFLEFEDELEEASKAPARGTADGQGDAIEDDAGEA